MIIIASFYTILHTNLNIKRYLKFGSQEKLGIKAKKELFGVRFELLVVFSISVNEEAFPANTYSMVLLAPC